MARLRTLFAFALVFASVALAIFAPIVAPSDPFKGGADALLPPGSREFLLGSDHLGRDILSELIFGARVSLAVGISAALSASVLGIVVGSLAGFFGGWVDSLLMRTSEFFQTLPRFVLALVIVAFFGGGILKLILVIAVLSWPQIARLVRAQILSLREATFVEAARLAGMNSGQIIAREILPNALAPVIVAGSLDIASAILLEASLSFFGLGDANLVSWGGMLNVAQPYLRQAWWMALFPGLAISVVVLAFNVLGDALNDALNPRLRETA
jgi:peptide/nickel transport system permease protein